MSRSSRLEVVLDLVLLKHRYYSVLKSMCAGARIEVNLHKALCSLFRVRFEGLSYSYPESQVRLSSISFLGDGPWLLLNMLFPSSRFACALGNSVFIV